MLVILDLKLNRPTVLLQDPLCIALWLSVSNTDVLQWLAATNSIFIFSILFRQMSVGGQSCLSRLLRGELGF